MDGWYTLEVTLKRILENTPHFPKMFGVLRFVAHTATTRHKRHFLRIFCEYLYVHHRAYNIAANARPGLVLTQSRYLKLLLPELPSSSKLVRPYNHLSRKTDPEVIEELGNR